jgi:hypothetical protein
MARLFGTQEWSLATINRRLAFLEYCSAHHRELTLQFGQFPEIAKDLVAELSPTWQGIEVDEVGAGFLRRAAEFAFATGDSSRALRLLNRAFSKLIPESQTIALSRYPGTFQEFLEVACLGVLLRRGFVTIEPEGVAFSQQQRVFISGWPIRTNPQELAAKLPLLLVLATEPTQGAAVSEFLRRSSDQMELAAALNAASLDPLFEVLGLVPGIYRDQDISKRFAGLNRRDGFAALRQLEREYAQRITFMRNDSFHWSRLQTRAPLVDWRLLVSQTLLVRLEARKRRDFGAKAILNPTDFSWWLATMFSEEEHR